MDDSIIWIYHKLALLLPMDIWVLDCTQCCTGTLANISWCTWEELFSIFMQEWPASLVGGRASAIQVMPKDSPAEYTGGRTCQHLYWLAFRIFASWMGVKLYCGFILRFLSFFFLGPNPWPVEGKGPIGAVAAGECHTQQCKIQVMSATYTTAPGNARSLTHWARGQPCIFMDTSQICFHGATMETP